MEQNVISAYAATMDDLIETLEKFSEEKINTVPFENSWTAAQVADHIYKSQDVFPGLLAGKTTETDRDTEKKKQMIESIFLDFSNKMKSPDFILPDERSLQKEVLINHLQEKGEEIKQAMHNHDLTKTFMDFELPGFGKFTGLEWGWFITYHTQRHTHQLNNMLPYLST